MKSTAKFLTALLLSTVITQPVFAASFTISDGQTVVANQTLNAAGETGFISAGGRLTVGGTAVNIFGVGAKTITNNGLISSNTGRGIDFGAGDGSFITNNGTISVGAAGLSSVQLDAGINGVTFINTGIITSAANNNLGALRVLTSNAVLTNSGSILATGAGEEAIVFRTGTNMQMTNTGTIQSTGAGASVIDFATGDTTFTNRGSIIASGGATQAISGGAVATTFNIEEGSKITGTIDFGAGGDVVNISAKSGTALSIANANVNFLNGVGGVVAGNTVVTVDSTAQVAQAQAISGLTSGAHGVVASRLSGDISSGGVSGVSSGDEPSFFYRSKPMAWLEIFGSTFNRKGDGGILPYDYDYGGVMAGYEYDVNFGRIGVMGGYSVGNSETRIQSIDTDIKSTFAGVYANHDYGVLNVTASLMGGYEWYENDRFVFDSVNGLEVAEGDFNNIFISPSVAVNGAFSGGDCIELRPGVSVTYTASFFDDYTESGTRVANVSYDDRTVHTLNTRVQMAGAYMWDNAELELRAGMDSRYTDQDDIDASLAGTNFSYAAADDNSIHGAIIGANVKFAQSDNVTLMGDIEHRRASGDEYQTTGRLRLKYAF